MAVSGRTPKAGASASSPAAASEPALREENVDEYIEVPDVIGGREGDYILRLNTESMRSAGFLGGDYVVVRPNKEADAGTIVAIADGEEVILTRVIRDGDELRLCPEGEEAEAKAIGEVSVLGRVVGVIRKV